MKKESTTKDVSLVLNKILTCLYVVILLLVINTGLILLNGGESKTEETTTDTNSDYDVSMFTSIDASGFMELFESKDTEVVYLGRETCSHCAAFLPILQEAQTEYGYITNYVDIENIATDTDDFNSMVSKINEWTTYYNSTIPEENQTDTIYGYTPMVVIIKDGSIKDVWIGSGESAAFTAFLEKNGL